MSIRKKIGLIAITNLSIATSINAMDLKKNSLVEVNGVLYSTEDPRTFTRNDILEIKKKYFSHLDESDLLYFREENVSEVTYRDEEDLQLDFDLEELSHDEANDIDFGIFDDWVEPVTLFSISQVDINEEIDPTE